MIWTPQQDAALVAANRWLRDKNGPQVFRLFGYAGVGKTTLAMHLGENASGIVLYAAFTGKAAHVMHRRGCEGASTLHSLIYIYREGIVGYEKKKDENGVEVDDYAKPIRGYWWELNEQSDLAHASLLIVDEVSMVNRELAEHVLSFGKKVLVIGDPFQLPPVKGYGYFMDEEPDVMLTEITRQAADNPIIRASMIVREGGRLRHESCGDCKVIPAYDIRDAELINVDQVLCGTHKKRLSLNDTMRRLLGSKGEVPLKGEKIICLKNLREEKSNFDDNYHDDDDYDDDDNENVKVRKQPLIMRNGETLTLTEDAILRLGEEDEELRGVGKDKEYLDMSLQPDNETERVQKVSPLAKQFECFDGKPFEKDPLKNSDLFGFGYAITVHKAQGSQWDCVLLYDESYIFEHMHPGMGARWLYTGITRASEKLTIGASTRAPYREYRDRYWNGGL